MSNLQKLDAVIERIVNKSTPVSIELACRDVDLDQVGSNGQTPLMVAASEGQLAAAEQLVRCGASVNVFAGFTNSTPLHQAAGEGHAPLVRFLLSQGADINAESKGSVTPLMVAAAWGQLDVVRLLLESGADWSRTDDRGGNATDSAREKGEDLVANFIETWIANHNP
ncbi:MAG: ankyrin repeat domain-containing protein [Burkholderiales bacterium]